MMMINELSETRFAEWAVAAVKECRKQGISRLEIPAGCHHVFPENLPEKLCYISNHDSGIKRILFDLEGMKDFIVDGNGAELIFHGAIVPFHCLRSANITIRNLKIDWDRPFLSQAEIAAYVPGILDLRFSDEYPVHVEEERMVFTGDHFYSTLLDNLLEFDADTRAPAAGVRDNFCVREGFCAEQLPDGLIRLRSAFPEQNTFTPGNQVVIKHAKRLAPAFALADCQHVVLEQIDIYHAGGMGVIGQNCRDIALDRVRVIRRPGSDRFFSVFVDAFHFVDCRGRLTIHDCVMEGQMDDGVNIHGIFLRVDKVLSARQVELRLMHPQQEGVQTLFAGDSVEFFDDRDMSSTGLLNVVQADALDSERFAVTFDSDLPAGIELEHLLVMRAAHDLDVQISRCTMQANRSRGILFNTYGHCRITDCYFKTPWQAILVNGAVDGKWHESGPAGNVEVSGCTFDRCGYAIDQPVIEATVRNGMPVATRTPYHQAMVVKDNCFIPAHANLLSVDNVADFEFFDNQLEGGIPAGIARGPRVGVRRIQNVPVHVAAGE
jgi:hypothetical protein